MACTWLTVRCLSKFQVALLSRVPMLMRILCSMSPFVYSPEGAETQRRLWEELVEKLERIQPGLMDKI